MWNAEKFKCNSVESAHKNDDYCKRYGFADSQACQADPRCMWDAADFECSANKIPAMLPGMPFSGIPQQGPTATSGSMTPSIPATGASPPTPPLSPQALAMIPCKQRPPAQCKGRSPRGGSCYMSGMECDEAEAGDLDVVCVQFNMNPRGCHQHPQCFWDPSDFECTSIKEQKRIPMPNGGVPASMPGFPTSGSSAAAPSFPNFPSFAAPAASGSAASVPLSPSQPGTLPGMPLNCEYIMDLKQCTPANGCILKKFECKNAAREMERPEMERPERPEGAFPRPFSLPSQATSGDSGRASPFGPSLKKVHEQSSKKTPFNVRVPHRALILVFGFFGSICFGLGLYSTTFAKRPQRDDVLLTEYSLHP